MTFKSQRGKTHHIRTVHFWSLNRHGNAQVDQENEDNNRHRDWPGQDQEYEVHHHQSADSPEDTHTGSPIGTPGLSRSSVSSVDDLGQVGERKEHPHLTGMRSFKYLVSLH